MTVATENDNNVKTRLSALEIRMASVEALLNNFVSGAGIGKSRKMSEAEKDQVKKKLLAGVPYNKQKLENLNLQELRMLGSALQIKAFGVNRDQLVNAILSGQKKKAR